jgi:hypothetical protein
VKGEYVSNKHDGHCPQMRWRMARHQDDTHGHAYLGMCEAVVRTIRKAKERAAVKVTTRRGRTAVHQGSVGSGCAKGRHRSTGMANEGATFARSLGATAQVHFCAPLPRSYSRDGWTRRETGRQRALRVPH